RAAIVGADLKAVANVFERTAAAGRGDGGQCGCREPGEGARGARRNHLAQAYRAHLAFSGNTVRRGCRVTPQPAQLVSSAQLPRFLQSGTPPRNLKHIPWISPINPDCAVLSVVQARPASCPECAMSYAWACGFSRIP